jgi:hypothetical protein
LVGTVTLLTAGLAGVLPVTGAAGPDRAPARSEPRGGPRAGPAGAAQPAGSAGGRSAGGRRAPALPGAGGRIRTSADAAAAVSSLAARRARLFAHPDAGSVRLVSETGSPAAVADATAVRALASRGLAYRGLRLTVRQVRVLQAGEHRALVAVVTDTSGYDVVVDGSNRRVSRVAPVRGARSRLELARTGRGWRVRSVTADPPGG